jgi:hypothetical protein
MRASFGFIRQAKTHQRQLNGRLRWKANGHERGVFHFRTKRGPKLTRLNSPFADFHEMIF